MYGPFMSKEGSSGSKYREKSSNSIDAEAPIEEFMKLGIPVQVASKKKS